MSGVVWCRAVTVVWRSGSGYGSLEVGRYFCVCRDRPVARK